MRVALFYHAISPAQIPPKWRLWAYQQAQDNYVLEYAIERFFNEEPFTIDEFIEDNSHEDFSWEEALMVYNRVAMHAFLWYGVLLKKWSI